MQYTIYILKLYIILKPLHIFVNFDVKILNYLIHSYFNIAKFVL